MTERADSPSLSSPGSETIDTSDREIVITRLVSAPRELVFKAWTDPAHVGHWWGPKGFTNTIHEMDVRPGGVWRLTMHGPDGTDYQNKIIYREIVQPELLAYSHVSGPYFEARVTFEAVGEKTRVTLRMLFETAAVRNLTVEKFGAIEGGQQTLARLDEYVAKL
jgi:uncharacterized protein YndB with AHSA1/START domain